MLTEKCDLFFDCQYGFRFSWSTADLLTFVSHRIVGDFSRSLATQAVALDISKAFDRVWYAGFLHKLESQVRYLALFLLFSVIDGFEWLVLHFLSYTLMTFLMILSVILLSMLMILFSTLSVTRQCDLR